MAPERDPPELREIEPRLLETLLGRFVPRGRMTPFLGAACSAAGGDLEPRASERDRIGDDIWALESGFGSDLHPLSSKEIAYAIAIAKNNGACVNETTTVPTERVVRHAGCLLPELQRALIRFGSCLEGVVGRGLGTRQTGVTDLRNCWVTVQPEDHEILQARLVAVVEAAKRLAGEECCHHTPKDALCEQGILQRLRVLALEILPRQLRSAKPTEKLLDLSSGLLHDLAHSRLMRYPDEDHFQISLSHLEWIAALLWHTLRFDARYYPGTAELAFQLSLHGSWVPALRPDLGQAAEVTLLPERTAHLLNLWFSYYEEQDRPAPRPGRFHVTIAEYLRHVEELRQKARESSDEAGAGPAFSAAIVDDIEWPWPIAMTTNYDRELERALELQERPYRVLVPGTATNESALRVPVWFCHTIYWADGRKTETSVLEGGGHEARMNELMDLPLVVKLHGTVGYALPKNIPAVAANGTSKSYSNPRYDFVLRESEYLESMVRFRKDEVLIAIEHRLFGIDTATKSTSKREEPAERNLVCFLGHSISDWNIRLRVYERAREYNLSETATKMLTVNRRIDRYKAQILAPLNCEVAASGLDVFVDLLDQAPEVGRRFKRAWRVYRDC